MSKAPQTNVGLYRRLLQQAGPYAWHIAGLLLLNLLATPVALLTPLPLTIAIDSVIGNKPLPHFLKTLLPDLLQHPAGTLLITLAALVVAINLLNQLQQLAVSLLSTYTGEKVMLSFRSQLFMQSQRLSLAYHDTRGTANSAHTIVNDAPAIRDITIYTLVPCFSAAVMLGGMIYVTSRINWELALLAMAISPVILVLHLFTRMRLRRQWSKVETFEASALAVVNEALGALRVVKAFGQEKREGERFIRNCRQSMLARVRFAAVERGLGLLVGLATAVGTAFVLYVGVSQVLSGTVTAGELLLVLSYIAQLYAPLVALTGVAANWQSQLARSERAFALLDEPPDVLEKPNARSLRRAQGSLSFRNASFSYDLVHPVLRDVCLDIDAGTRVGIMGPTGAGKSTLVSLLTRFYDPTAGQILLDGVDLRDYKVSDLRNQFAIVLQDPVLFSTSIGENIAYARPNASFQEIVSAAKAANIHDFVDTLPEGYDTQVGERGMRLSGGERQRLALARAFLKDTPILILDEPTSSVDIITEATIMEAMVRLMRGRTSFMITHRLAALEGCDSVLEISQGKVEPVALSKVNAHTTGNASREALP